MADEDISYQLMRKSVNEDIKIMCQASSSAGAEVIIELFNAYLLISYLTRPLRAAKHTCILEKCAGKEMACKDSAERLEAG